MIWSRWFCFALVGLFGASSVASATELLRVVCPKRPADLSPPTVDGRLDDDVWASAAVVKFHDAATGEEPRRATRVRLLWDDVNLYFGFDCDDDDPKPNAAMTNRDANLWEEEVVEMFLSPTGELHTYAELEVNPLNTLFDAMILNNGKRTQVLRDWDMEAIRHAVAFRSDGWSVEVALPFDEFYTAPHTPPRVGDTWRMNLYRIERSDPKNPELTSWSRTLVYNFHNSEAFGILQFGETPVTQSR